MRTSQWNGLNLESCPILTAVGFLLIKVKGMLFAKFFFKFSFWKFFCNETLVYETGANHQNLHMENLKMKYEW